MFASSSYSCATFLFLFSMSTMTVNCKGSLADSPAAHEAQIEEPAFTECVETGLVFLNGNAIAGPYLIEGWEDRCTINGQAVVHLPSTSEHADDESDGKLSRRRGERGPGKKHGVGRSRKRSPGILAATSLRSRLEEDYIVFLFEEHAPFTIRSPSDKVDFFSALLANDPSDEQVDAFRELCGDETLQDRWLQFLADYVPDQQHRQEWKAQIETILEVEAESLRQIHAVKRFEMLAYPLTVLAMLLAAFSVGHLLHWSSHGIAVSEESSGLSQTVSACERALLLIIALSGIDLVWTILAAQAGQMIEINPIAARIIDSPMSLVVLKSLSLLVGVLILYLLRRRQLVQKATWWMCMVLVLVTCRWVVFGGLAG